MPSKVLFVDDEENVLNALKRQFRKNYKVSTANCGAAALQSIQNEGPFDVIVTDMQMPEMNGVQFLERAQKLAPDSVRLMLTGNADQKTAVDAVNKGNVFSFYTKPCTAELMAQALQKAVKQHQLITAERELLEGTLNGSVKLLTDMMSMAAPELFGRCLAIRDSAKKVVNEMELENAWDFTLAAMLCNLASVTLPPDTIKKLSAGQVVSDSEKKMVARLPEVTKSLICNIPRLEKVANIIYYHQKQFNGSGFPNDDVAGEDIPIESRILKVLVDIEDLKATGIDEDEAIAELSSQQHIIYDPDIFKMVSVALSAAEFTQDSATSMAVSINGLKEGQMLVSNIETEDGRMLFAAGLKLTTTTIERILNYHHVTKIKEPIQVILDEEDDGTEEAVL